MLNCWSDLVNFIGAINNWFSGLMTKITFIYYLSTVKSTIQLKNKVGANSYYVVTFST